MKLNHQTVSLGLALAFVLSTTLCLAAPRTIKAVPTKQKSVYSKQIAKVLRGSAAPDDALIRNWYWNSLLAELTQPVVQKNAHNARKTIVSDLQTAAEKAPAVHAKIRDNVYKYCSAMVDPKNGFSPIAQYNAMLILGVLNEKDSTKVGGQLPVPYSKSLGKMGGAIKPTSKHSDAVRVAALIGILRHAQLDRAGVAMDSKYKSGVINFVFGLLQSECPTTRSKEGHEWMQRRATEILGTFGWAGTNGNIAQAFDKIIRDEKASIAMRCTAIDALSQLKISSDPGINVADTTMGIATTTVKVCRVVNKRLEQRFLERENNGGGFDGGFGGGFGDGSEVFNKGGGPRPGGGRRGGGRRGGGDGRGAGREKNEEERLQPKEDPLLTEARRDVKHRLGCVQTGLARISGLAPEDKQVDNLNQLVSSLLTSIDTEGLDPQTFKTNVDKLATDLEDMFGIEIEEVDKNLQGPGQG